MQAHLDDATLDALVDGELPAHRSAEVALHLETCDPCRARAERLRTVMRSLAALPGSVRPEADLLPGIRARLAPRAGPADLPAPGGAARILRALRWRLAAAAVLVASISSALTVAVMRSRTGAEAGTLAGPEPWGGLPPALLANDPELARLSVLEAEYVRAAEDLASAFGARSGALPPETRTLVERNLAAIDRAIVEVRSALLETPASEPLRVLFLASHERKLDFLRRASELTQ